MGTDHTLPDDPDLVNSTDITWTLGPPPERIELDLFDVDDAWAYTRRVQEEACWLRMALHDTLTHLHHATVQAGRDQLRIKQLTAEVRRLRPSSPGSRS